MATFRPTPVLASLLALEQRRVGLGRERRIEQFGRDQVVDHLAQHGFLGLCGQRDRARLRLELLPETHAQRSYADPTSGAAG
jgi:hypothetical protein